MVKQYSENQYDDDLTVGMGGYDDSYYTDEVDLFEFSTDDDSPIGRLKSLILSIDWEITDEVLQQFNEELVDLKSIWAGEKINLVYIQALEKISKYIYQFKADSHPNAIKLLLTLYYNLEKIVSSDELSEEEKKQLLLDDIKKFENLKRHISHQGVQSSKVQSPLQSTSSAEAQAKPALKKDDLINLKAIVLGIDWEITDEDLNELRQEVVRLEEKFSDSRPKLIFLQGIGTIGAYIKLKKGDAHNDAFKVLHLFFEGLEKIVETPMSFEEEKAVLLPAVEKFNALKALIGDTVSSKGVGSDGGAGQVEDASGQITPAFANIPEEETVGFQAESEAQELGLEGADNVSSHIDNFFSDEPSAPGAAQPSVTESKGLADGNQVNKVDKELALQGVDVEADDEDVENDGGGGAGVVAALSDDVLGDQQTIGSVTAASDDEGREELLGVDREIALQGVDVETEADDDSDEKALPTQEGKLAPALLDNDEESIFSADSLENINVDPVVADEIFGKLDGFLTEEVPPPVSMGASGEEDVSTAEGAGVVESAGNVGEESQKSTPVAEADVEDGLEQSFDKLFGDADIDDAVQDDGDVEGLFGGFGDGDAPQDVKSEVDSHVDDFFQLEEGIEEPKEGELLDAMPTRAVGEESEAKDVEVVESALEDAVDGDLAEDKIQPEPLLADIEKTGDAAALAASELDGKTATSDEVVFELANDADTVVGEEVASHLEQTASAEIEPQVTEASGLLDCVHSLELELDDKILIALTAEIKKLEEEWRDNPGKKLFLKLISTVADHIDKFRYDASGDAFTLLKSISTNLFALEEDDSQHSEEILVSETLKVIQWQQALLDSNFGGVDKGVGGAKTDIVEVAAEKQDDTVLQDVTMKPSTTFDGVNVDITEKLKNEISTLRKTLQEEIAELRREMRNGAS